jgi:8-oxo-dGTP pyrophosphatase MutT (NUDIX family)
MTLTQEFDAVYEGQDQGYVLQIIRSSRTGLVAMVSKTKPSWQAGRLNFPGGKIEPGETPRQAAIRENLEETAVPLSPEGLRPVALLVRRGRFRLYVFAGETEKVLDARACTEEEVFLETGRALKLMTEQQAIENVGWLYAMAFDGYDKVALIEYD